MSLVRLIIDTPQNSGDVDGILRLQNTGNAPEMITRVADWIQGLVIRGGSVRLVSNAVRAAQVGTLTGDPSAADTITINGVAFTARASGAVANEFNISAGNVTTTMNNLVAAINASVTAKVKGEILASNVAGVLTLSAIVPGTGGNLFTVTESMANFTLVGTALTGGTEGTQYTVSAGR